MSTRDASAPALPPDAAAVEDRVGEVLLGKYRIERELGRGGMGYVVAARHLELGELVAIKMILGEYAKNDDMVRRFMREARAAAQIASEHVVRVTDVGRLPTSEPYMVMELLKGEDLEQVLSRGPMPIEEAVDMLMQVLEAVAEAHAAGIVHRDLKPANLFVTRRRSGASSVKVLDFGISKLVGDETSRTLAMTQGVLESPLYMSPEQLRTPGDVDGRGDVWSLGVILFQMLTLDYPFVAETLPQLVVKVIDGDPIPLRERLPTAPEELERVVLKCLTKDRAHRYGSVTELAHVLAPFGTAAARQSLVAVECALPSGEMASSPTLRAPAPSSSPDMPVSHQHTLPMWPNQASTLEPVDLAIDSRPDRVEPRGEARPKKGLLGLSSVVALAVAVFAVVVAARAPSDVSAAARAQKGAEPPVSERPSSPAASSVAVSLTASASASVSSATPSAPPSAERASKVATTPKLIASGSSNARPAAAAAPSSAPTASAAAPNCSPPYKVGNNGTHIPKPECL